MRLAVFLLAILSFTFSFAQETNKLDAKGLKQGKWVKKYKGSDNVLYVGNFKDDIPVGKFKFYYSTGKLKALNDYRNNGKDSYAAAYYENGKVMSYGKYTNKKKDSTWKYFDDKGNLTSTEEYANGEKNGKTVVYYPINPERDRRNRVLEVTEYRDGLRHGDWIQYYKSGKKLAEGTYELDDFQGMVTYYHSNEEKKITKPYKNGLEHGFTRTYDGAGKETSKTYYWKGRKLEGELLEKHLTRLRAKKAKEREALKKEPKN